MSKQYRYGGPVDTAYGEVERVTFFLDTKKYHALWAEVEYIDGDTSRIFEGSGWNRNFTKAQFTAAVHEWFGPNIDVIFEPDNFNKRTPGNW